MEELHERYRDVVERQAFRVLRDHHDAQDAAQETFLRLTTTLISGGEVTNCKGFLLQVCRNLCLDRLRDRKRYPSEPLSDATLAGSGLEDNPETVFLLLDARRRVRGRLMRLTPQHQEVLHLRVIEGLSHQEIATKLGVTRRAVEAHFQRARRRFQESPEAA